MPTAKSVFIYIGYAAQKQAMVNFVTLLTFENKTKRLPENIKIADFYHLNSIYKQGGTDLNYSNWRIYLL